MVSEHLNIELVNTLLASAVQSTEGRAQACDALLARFHQFPGPQQIACLNTVFEHGRANHNLDIFCALLSTVPETLLFDAASCLVLDSTWAYVALCLSGSEPPLQKQGAHILSKCAHSPKVPCLNGSEHAWRAFFALLGAGREKQLHLVEPALELFGHIGDLPAIWQKCVYGVYLRHPQSAVVYRTAIHLLQQPAGLVLELLGGLLQAINQNHYHALSTRAFQALSDFSSGVGPSEWPTVISSFTAVHWNVVAFWKALQSFLGHRPPVSAPLAQDLISSALRLPHLYLREQSLGLLVDALWDPHDYHKVLKLAGCVPRECLRGPVAEAVVQAAVEALVKCRDFPQISALMAVAGLGNVRVQIDAVSPDVALLARVNGFSPKSVDLLEYFRRHLRWETADAFLQLCAKDPLSQDELWELCGSPEKLSDSQLYVVLELAEPLGLPISPKVVDDSFTIIVSQGGKDTAVRSTDWRVCRASLAFVPTTETLDAIRVFKHLLDSQPNSVLPRLCQTVHDILQIRGPDPQLKDFVGVLHQRVQQIKRDPLYKDVLREFAKIVYSDKFVRCNGDISGDLVGLAQSCPFLRLELIQRIQLLDSVDVACYVTCLPAIADLYYQGAIVTNDERTHFYLCQEFMEEEQRSQAHLRLGDRSNPNLLSASARLQALINLVAIGEREPELVLNLLTERYMLYFKKRYFPDSKIHYEKLRILQAMLLLVAETRLPEDLCQRTSCFVLKNLQEESNQNCVKQILNCILVFLLKDVFALIKWITSIPKMSPAVLVSVMPAIYHLTLLGDEKTIQETINLLLPWTMGPQLKSRVYSQLCIQRLLAHGRKMNYTALLNTNQHLTDCIDKVLEQTGSIFTDTLSLDLAFYSKNHPISWTILLSDLPRLYKVGQVEWQNLHYLIQQHPALATKGHQLAKTLLTSKPAGTDSETHGHQSAQPFLTRKPADADSETQAHQVAQLQTKIVPWRAGWAQLSTDLVLIACLVDKAQNLGGLSRTCEVFGVRDVVFRSAQVTEEKEFTSLSMSSESWINRLEVKVPDLRQYLRQLRSQGYGVVGAEQTVGSRRLDGFQFPRRVALVLGNEKTGIPADIIPLLDICLEIPQFGLTRSLNVHVAGAMFMWEYVKQHKM